MSIQLIEALEKAVASEDLATAHMPDASVRVQFAAGDWHKVCEALKDARAEYDASSNINASSQEDISALRNECELLKKLIEDLKRELEDASKLPPPLLELDTGTTSNEDKKSFATYDGGPNEVEVPKSLSKRGK